MVPVALRSRGLALSLLLWHASLASTEGPAPREEATPVPAPAPGPAETPSPEEAATTLLTQDTLRATLEEVSGGFSASGHACRGRGVLPSEGLALVAAARRARVEVMIESGTASGVSTEMMARALGPGVRIYTIDSDRVGYDAKSGMISQACQRLKKYPSVTCIKGDSNREIPKLLKKNRGRRVGLFLDGPKHGGAAKLCVRSLNDTVSPPPLFCAMHDVAKSGKGKHSIKVYRVMNEAMWRWKRTVLITDEEWYRDKYAELDSRCNFYSKDRFPGGFGVAIVVGKESMPGEVSCRETGLGPCKKMPR